MVEKYSKYFWISTILFITIFHSSEMASTITNPNYKRDKYLEERALVIKQERSLALGAEIQLTHEEQKLNTNLLMIKQIEMNKGFENITIYNPAQHFFKRKHFIESSRVFKFLRRMPKGAVLHVHSTALVGKEFIVKNITYMDNLYICFKEKMIQLRFYKSPPNSTDVAWQLLKTVRENSQNIEEFDFNLEKHFTLNVDDPFTEYPNIDDVWSKFSQIFSTQKSFLTYKPAWELYLYEALTQFHADNIMYMEIRSSFPNLYDLNGRKFSKIETAKIYKDINDRFRRDHPDSFGFRIIYAVYRLISPEQLRNHIMTAINLKAEFGDFIVGFDLVGQEDKGMPLKDFADELVNIPSNMNVFYHCGESNWYGTSSDYNLIDAVLLGAKRLGHAYALLKHPVVAKLVKEKDIAIEISPLSNQILMLVADIRNHPASLMLANNYSVVISSDDPGLWGSLPMSHDMYMAFMGLASKEDDIRLLKQLVINSIKYSSMPLSERKLAMTTLMERWDQFVLNELNSTKNDFMF